MPEALKVVLETGPKAKKVVALAPRWPGLERGAKTGDAALEMLEAYIPRYAPVAEAAGLGRAYRGIRGLEVVERYPGTGSTDFWGISFAFSSIDRQPVGTKELERELALMDACWAFFDDASARVSAEMRKGPRGGGRDRDRIRRHVLVTEQDWGKKLGLGRPDPVVTSGPALADWRLAYLGAIREFHAQGREARSWPLRYLVRHTAFHSMDHAWEMEDKDLSGAVDPRP